MGGLSNSSALHLSTCPLENFPEALYLLPAGDELIAGEHDPLQHLAFDSPSAGLHSELKKPWVRWEHRYLLIRDRSWSESKRRHIHIMLHAGGGHNDVADAQRRINRPCNACEQDAFCAEINKRLSAYRSVDFADARLDGDDQLVREGYRDKKPYRL